MFFGEGFGSEILGRSRIEVVPLELFYKIGILGLILSLIPVLYIIFKSINNKLTCISLQMSSIALFSALVSVTNPFLYTPMGVYIIGISLISMENTTRLNKSLD